MRYGNKNTLGLPYIVTVKKLVVGLSTIKSLLTSKKQFMVSIFWKIQKFQKKRLINSSEGGKKYYKNAPVISPEFWGVTDVLLIICLIVICDYDDICDIWWKKLGGDHYPIWNFMRRYIFLFFIF